MSLVRDALAEDFDVFWDQEVPPSVDWDAWIRQHLAESKCVLVFWSAASVGSDYVRHEASIAKGLGKLIPVFIEQLKADQLPMGHLAQQAANLVNWTGDVSDAEWLKLKRHLETKLSPLWVQRRIRALEGELTGERQRRQGSEYTNEQLRLRLSAEDKAHADLQLERDNAVAETERLKSILGRSRTEGPVIDLSRDLTDAISCFPGVHIAPNIPEDKERTAKTTWGVPDNEPFYILIDLTACGTAKNFIAFGKNGLWYHNLFTEVKKHFIPLDSLKSCVITDTASGVRLNGNYITTIV